MEVFRLAPANLQRQQGATSTLQPAVSIETPASQPTFAFKIMFAGASGVGKTSFLQRHRTGEFARDHIPTLGCDISALSFQTTRGLVTFNVWDLGSTSDERYFLGARGLVIVYDLTDPETLQTALAIEEAHACQLPIIICGNKVDVKDRDRTVLRPAFRPDTTFFKISARSNYNFERPFLTLARKLVGDETLEFTEFPPLTPPEACSIERDLLASFDDKLTYVIGPQDAYDALGEALRDSLEGLLLEASLLGYTATVEVSVSISKG